MQFYKLKLIKTLKISSSKIYLITVSFIVYIISLTQDALSANFSENKTLLGIEALFAGGLVILGGGLLEWLIWLANPLYFLSILFLFKSDKRAKICSLLATILALSFMTWNEILVSESGHTEKINALGLGYWLWVLSLIILTIGIFLFIKKEKPKIFAF